MTRDRLYLDAMENVYSKTSKVMIDTKGSNNLLYLPLDKMMRGSVSMPATNSTSDKDGNYQKGNQQSDYSASKFRSNNPDSSRTRPSIREKR